MIPAVLSEKLEKIQRQALRIIYGWDVDVETLMDVKGIGTLERRRERAVMHFALKNEDKDRYGKRWFKKTEENGHNLRESTRKKYKMPMCRTSRMRSNPVTYMTEKLNEHYSK